MDNARPGKEFLERCSDLLVGWRIGMRKENGRVRLTRLASRNPIEIDFAIRRKRETLAPPLPWKMVSIFLALETERKNASIHSAGFCGSAGFSGLAAGRRI